MSGPSTGTALRLRSASAAGELASVDVHRAPEKSPPRLPTKESSVPAEPISTPDVRDIAPSASRPESPNPAASPALKNSLCRRYCTPLRSDPIERRIVPLGMTATQISHSMECYNRSRRCGLSIAAMRETATGTCALTFVAHSSLIIRNLTSLSVGSRQVRPKFPGF